jgi:hypothetical protein
MVDDRMTERSLLQGFPVKSAWTVCVEFVFKRIVLLLVVLAVLGVSTLIWRQVQLQERLMQSTALDHAKRYTAALAEFRTQYTTKVVATAKANGLKVTHDYSTPEMKGKGDSAACNSQHGTGKCDCQKGVRWPDEVV